MGHRVIQLSTSQLHEVNIADVAQIGRERRQTDDAIGPRVVIRVNPNWHLPVQDLQFRVSAEAT
ncbi:hypothetical protein [Reinekea sp.]|uniref:hypothetical protein n=1 Tax=Reinekea sp. TaxID=1970455 RepID=UPI002A7F6F91|nr:hypothetical protein [Reinekea sp.]